MVTLPETVTVDGRDWHLFLFDFDTADGKFSSHFYAISFEHAVAILAEMKESAVLRGQVGGVIPA